jgi:hypothetical protein
MIDFPASPTVGQQFTAANVTWTWDGTKWTAAGISGPFLPLTGGNLTGPLALAADPTIPLGASTKEYVDARAGINSNRIINGDMRIAQRWVNGGSPASGYMLDRWALNLSPFNLVAWAQGSGTGAPLNFGFEYWIGIQSSTAHVIAAGDYAQIYQPIEADWLTDLAWGTPQAQPVTLSFLAYSSLAGTFSGCITNGPATRSYPFTYTLAALTWTKISITIPGDTAGTWTLSGNGAGATLHFSLGSGTTYSGPPNVWASANYVGATGSVAIIATNGAYWNVTGVKLEVGSIATPFNKESLAKALADCQRYYEKSYDLATLPKAITQSGSAFLYANAYSVNTPQNGGMEQKFATTKRSPATITCYSPQSGNSGVILDQGSNVDITATIFNNGQQGFGWYGQAAVAATINFSMHWTAEAEL